MTEIRFGNYRITDTIGSGALSTIYRAVQEPLGRIVALKALKTQIAATSSFGEQLDREAKVLTDLVHPNVVLLLDASRTTSGRPFIVLEHIDGPSLQDLLVPPSNAPARPKGATRRKLPVASALAIACGICAGLEHVHERGVVHRDVKPSNVLLAKSGIVKVIDFGIAQRARLGTPSEALLTEGITASGRIAPEQLKDAYGTPAYMSPEQILGDFVDGRSDLFSLGVVLYQMLSGYRPFDSEDETAEKGQRSAAHRIRREAAPALRERAPHVPRTVERIVMRLLEKSPNDRYESASQVKDRLEAALRAETRDDPTALVRAALTDGGLRERDPKAEPRRAPAPRTSRSSRWAASRLTRTVKSARSVLGFVAVTSAFSLAVLLNEGTNSAREARAALARPATVAVDETGGLRVLATPWAHVSVDGHPAETTPFARPIALSPGKHWVTLAHPEAPSAVEREILVVRGETVMLDVTMDLSTEDAGKDAR